MTNSSDEGANLDGPSREGASPIPPTAKVETSKKTRNKRGFKTKQNFQQDATRKRRVNKVATEGASAKFPRHAVSKALRIPRAIIDQNAGRECSDQESATFVGVGYNGPYAVELSSALKYGFLERPRPRHVGITDRARHAVRPQNPGDEIAALRAAILEAPDVSAVYKHYRGENIPDGQFFDNALVDKFAIPAAKVSEFRDIFFASLEDAQLIEQRGDKRRILDVTDKTDRPEASRDALKKATRPLKLDGATDTCFVIMPFSDPIGNYFQNIYEPAIRKAGLRPIRADADIFGTGKIIDQIWSGITSAKMLVAELTTRNPNVFYELGLAHALQKPVVLVSSNGDDVPFDLKHIRVIYYDVNDPFWGSKLIDKVAENIVSALNNPEEAIFERALNRS